MRNAIISSVVAKFYFVVKKKYVIRFSLTENCYVHSFADHTDMHAYVRTTLYGIDIRDTAVKAFIYVGIL